MTDDVSGVGLWGDDADMDERELPVSAELRGRVREWVDEYTATIGGKNHWWGPQELREHDRRGFQLGRELQQALGPGYRIVYSFETDEVRREMRRSD